MSNLETTNERLNKITREVLKLTRSLEFMQNYVDEINKMKKILKKYKNYQRY